MINSKIKFIDIPYYDRASHNYQKCTFPFFLLKNIFVS